MGYTKLFSEIIMSTIWREPDHVRLLWITMLALKDRWHIVNASLPGLADSARITMDQCQDALLILAEPDPHSRTKDYEGRRIESCDGGWIILNGEKYRNKMSLDERREYQRIKQKEYRDRKKIVKSCQQSSQQFTHTDTDTEADTDTKKRERGDKSPPPRKVKRACQIPNDFDATPKNFEWLTKQDFKICRDSLHPIEHQKFINYYKAKGTTMKDWQAAWRNWMIKAEQYYLERK